VLVNGVEGRLQQIIAGVAEETDSILLETGVMPDHVHGLLRRPPALAVGKFTETDMGADVSPLFRER
jgi:REP element-mobilizing transposase RayT